MYTGLTISYLCRYTMSGGHDKHGILLAKKQLPGQALYEADRSLLSLCQQCSKFHNLVNMCGVITCRTRLKPRTKDRQAKTGGHLM